MGMKYAAVVALVLTGCGGSGDTTPMAGQTEAVDIIWRVDFQQTKSLPEIYWRWDRCDSPNGEYPPDPWCDFVADGERVAGLQSDYGWVEVGAPWKTGMISDTALAHELLHAVIGDTNHLQQQQWARIDPINADLRSLGL